jgi:hypothetical protein
VIELNISPSEAGNSPLSGLVAGAFPVLLGAAIGFGVSFYFAWRAAKDQRLALAYELFFEAQVATETISELHRVLTKNLNKVGTPYYVHHWQAVQLPSGFDWSARCKLNPAGLALLASAGKFELINELMELAKLHDLALIITSDFSRRQEALTDKLRAEGETKVDGTTVSFFLTDATINKHAPEIMRVEDLLKQLLMSVVEGAPFAQGVTKRLGPELRAALSDKRFKGRIEYVPKSDAAVESSEATTK